MNKSEKFNLKHIENLTKTGAKEYIIKYFIPLTNGSHAFFCADTGIYQIFDEATIKRTYFKRMDKYLSTYYFEEFKDVRTVVYEINKPALYEDKLNLCPPFLNTYKEYNSFDNSIKTKVQYLLTHMEKYLCSGSKLSFQFIIKWFAKMARGFKNDSCLYLKGPQGIGKSCIIEWIRQYVIGIPLCFQGGSSPLKTRFNGELAGKLLVVFEELENFTTSEWQSISSVLKRQITSNTIMIEQKGIDAIEQNNLNNYIILSNNEAIQDDDGRRYFILDVSTEKLGDVVYWTYLNENILTKEVGEAFFSYLYEVDLTGFKSQSYPITQNKKDSFAKKLDSVHKFLKDMFVIKNIGVEKVKLADFHSEYETYCTNNNITKIKSKIDFNSSLKNIGIIYYKSNGVNYYKISKSDLKNISDKFHWVHDLDEVEPIQAEQPIQPIQPIKNIKPKSKSAVIMDQGISPDNEDMCEIFNDDIEKLPQQTAKVKVTKKVVKKVAKPVPTITDEESAELFDLF